MNTSVDVEHFAKHPEEMVELCCSVIDYLDAGSDQNDTAAMEVQLREIANAIQKLEKQKVPVPDVLRGEKTRLAAALGMRTEAKAALNSLADELSALVQDLNVRLGRVVEISVEEGSPKKPRKKAKRKTPPRTDKATLRKLIIEALRHMGGSAHKNDVLKYMEDKLGDHLLPGDLEWRKATHDYVWQNTSCWERFTMTQDGTLKTGSPRGIWELSEEHL